MPCEGVCGMLPDLHYKGSKSPEESEGQFFSPIYFYLPFVLLIFAVHLRNGFSEPIPLRVIHQRPQGKRLATGATPILNKYGVALVFLLNV